MDDQVKKAFFAIAEFVEEVGSVFEDRNSKPLVLYRRLFEKTGVTNKAFIMKSYNAFKAFTAEYKDAILQRDVNTFRNKTIFYREESPVIGVPIGKVFLWASSNEKEVIWNHLLVILETTNPNSGAIEELEKLNNKLSLDNSKEGKFVQDVMAELESSVGSDVDNPMEAIMSLMQGGFMNKLMESMQTGVDDGEIDINKLMGAAQSMLGAATTPSIEDVTEEE